MVLRFAASLTMTDRNVQIALLLASLHGIGYGLFQLMVIE